MKMGVVLTRNIALGIGSILYGERGDPVDPADSGWQFTEGSRDQSAFENAQIWTVREVLEVAADIAPFINMPVGTIISRSSRDEPWDIEP